jgi:hypothetical protein
MNTELLRSQIAGDLWRGGTGILGASTAYISADHEALDAGLRTAGIIIGLLVGIASFISLVQRITATHRRSKWDAVIFQEVKKQPPPNEHS